MVSRTDVTAFYRRRAARLLPLYYIALLVGLMFVAPTDGLAPFLEQAFLFFTGTFTFTQRYFFPELNFVLWSLSLELLFSLCFPALLFLMRKYGVRRVVIVCCVGALVARFFGVFLILRNDVSMFTGTTTPIFNNIFCRIDDFALGMGLAYLFARKPRLSAPWCYVTGFALLFMGCTLRDFSQDLLPVILEPLSNTLINLGFFLLVAIMLMRPLRVWKLTIENGVLQLIGLMSYSIFVWHGIAIAPLRANTDAVHLIRYAILVFSLSFLTYRYIETSSPKRVRDILPGKSPLDAAAG